MKLFGKAETLSVADLVTRTLADIGVERIWGVTGDSVNGGAIPGQCGGVKAGHVAGRGAT